MLDQLNIDQKRQLLIQMIYILLAVTTLVVFWQVNLYDFVNFDDPLYVLENSHVQSGFTLKGIQWAFSTTYADSLWHPLIWISLMLDCQIVGLKAGGFHLTNLLLHMLNTLMLFWLFHRMTGEIWKSAFVAAFFALHPLHVESVAWIAERKDVLSAFFWMLTLCCYVFYTEKPAVGRYMTVLLFFVFALLSKPMVVTLPVIMIFLDYWPLNRFETRKGKWFLWQLKEKLPFFILSAFFSALTIYTQYNPSIKHFPWSFRLANAAVSFATYLGKTFWPRDMAAFYPLSFQIPPWQVFFSWILIIIVTFASIMMIKKRPYLFVGWLWCFIAILPVIGIIQSGEQAMADRYTYLPLIGISIVLAWGAPSLMKSAEIRKKFLFPAVMTCLIILSSLTWQQCRCWQNSITLFSHALRTTRNNALAYHNLGIALLTKGKISEAIDSFNKAIRFSPDNALSYINRGNCYEALGRYKEAVENYNEAIRIKPDFAISYYNMGIIQTKLGFYKRALDYFNEAIRLKPDYTDAYNNKGIIYGKLNLYRIAIDNFNIAIGLNQNYADAYSNRGNAYFNLGEHQRAVEDYNKSIHLKPNNADLHNIRGIAYLHLNLSQRAVDDFNQAIILKPDEAMFYYNRGNANLKSGQYQSAVNDFSEAIRLKADYASAYNNRGSCYFKLGLYQRAVDDFNDVIRLTPDNADAYNNLSGALLKQNTKVSGCYNAKKACGLGNCKALEWARSRKYCR